ncbi:MAG: hypothetical protein AB7Y46_01465 [Armatimonadota bacterium]
MLRDVPHVKTIVGLGLGGLLLGVLLLTWVYPAFQARVCAVKQEKTRQLWREIYGFPDRPSPMLKSGTELSRELHHTVGGKAAPEGLGTDAYLRPHADALEAARQAPPAASPPADAAPRPSPQ